MASYKPTPEHERAPAKKSPKKNEGGVSTTALLLGGAVAAGIAAFAIKMLTSKN